jgi:membrane associated rhomboid family serine protease
MGSAFLSGEGMGGVAWWAHIGGFVAGIGLTWWGKNAGWLMPLRTRSTPIQWDEPRG